MFKKQKIAVVMLTVAVFLAMALFVGNATAQKENVPKAQDKIALSVDEVRQLILMMDTDKNGKVSKQEFMNFMSAEFDRLDKDKSGELDVKELALSQLRPSAKPPVGK